jgi:hypothetical protein
MYVVKQLRGGKYVVCRCDANGEVDAVMESVTGCGLALFSSTNNAKEALESRLSRGSAAWFYLDGMDLKFAVPERISKYDGLPRVGTCRPGSMFGGLKTDHADSIQAAWRAWDNGRPVSGAEMNEEAWLSGVPALAFK